MIAPTAIKPIPMPFKVLIFSPKNKIANKAAITTLSLSIGATLVTGPYFKAKK